MAFIREKGRITGKLHLVLRDGRYFLESEDEVLLRRLRQSPEVAECFLEVQGSTAEVDSLKVEKLTLSVDSSKSLLSL